MDIRVEIAAQRAKSQAIRCAVAGPDEDNLARMMAEGGLQGILKELQMLCLEQAEASLQAGMPDDAERWVENARRLEWVVGKARAD